MKTILLSFIFSLYALAGNTQITNPDFENWQTDSLGKTTLTGWEHLLKYDFANPMPLATWRSSNSQNNTYALTVSRWYHYTWDLVRQKAPISDRPTALAGYYKYTENNLFVGRLDTGLVSIYITARNSVTNMEDTLGSGSLELTLNSNYIFFSCPITYTLSGIPDSMLIHITPSKFAINPGGCSDSTYCSFLTVDNLELVFPDDVEEQVHNERMAVYPNPVRDILVIGPQHAPGRIMIQNITGQAMVEKELPSNEVTAINTAEWKPGIYIARLSGPNGFVSTMKLVKE